MTQNTYKIINSTEFPRVTLSNAPSASPNSLATLSVAKASGAGIQAVRERVAVQQGGEAGIALEGADQAGSLDLWL